MSSATAYVVIISAVAAALVSIVNAVSAGWGRQEARYSAAQATVKLDQIHELTNSNMTALKAQLQAALDRINALEFKLTTAVNSVAEADREKNML